jgi:hypothetical protein
MSSVVCAAFEQNIHLNFRHRISARLQSSLRLARFLCGIYLIALLVAVSSASAQDVTTWHYDNARTGVQSAETILTPSNVNSAHFGKVHSFPVSGDVYAQPLYLGQYQMNDGQLHNVLIVATAEDYVYAFDADGKNPTQGFLWRKSLLGAGETWGSYSDVGTVDIKPNIGIIGTPVVDRAGGTIYVLAKSKTSGTTNYIQRLHALNIADGTEKLNGPTTIQATVKGLGDGGTSVSFDPFRENQRPALLLAPTPGAGSGNSVVIGWASHGDHGLWHGWLIAYDASNIANKVGAWTDTPNGTDGGIWMSGGGPSTDGNGNIFAADGNGKFDANTGGTDYGDSAFRLTLDGSGLVLRDYFTPANQSSLNTSDNDMGTSALLLLPTQSGSIPNVGVTADKSGQIHLVNRDNMGHFTTPNNSSRQSFSDGGFSIHNSFAFFNNTLYLAVDGGPLEAWTFNPQTELFSTTPQSKSGFLYKCPEANGCGSTPSISANGTSNAIVWSLDNSLYYNKPSVLHAYDAANLATELYNSAQVPNRDAGAIAVKFTTPTIANGQVYVGARNAVTVYGLLSTGPLAATPTFSPGSGTYTTTQSVSISDSTPSPSIYYTSDGSTPSTGSNLYTVPIQVAQSETLQAVAIAPGFSLSDVGSASYTINNGPPAAIPTFSPGSGTYTTTQTVTISDSTSNASIYYTTNGNTPNTGSTLYTGPIQVSTTELLKAVAIAPGFSQSNVGSASYTINNGSGCNPPSSPGLNVCEPVNASTVGSPVSVLASATVTGTISRMEVWVDGVKKFSTFGSTTLSTSLSLPAGSHKFVFYAVNTAGTKWMQTVTATVSGGGGCSPPTSPGVNVCQPVNGSTVASPVPAQAAATVTGTISRMEVWVDGVKKFSTFGSTTLSTSISLASGSHRFSFYAVNTAGTKWETTVNATVQ